MITTEQNLLIRKQQLEQQLLCFSGITIPKPSLVPKNNQSKNNNGNKEIDKTKIDKTKTVKFKP